MQMPHERLIHACSTTEMIRCVFGAGMCPSWCFSWSQCGATKAAGQHNTMKYESKLTILLINRPEKKQLAGYGGVSGAGGAGRESPIGDDDNDVVRQRAGYAKSRLPFPHNFLPAQPTQHPCISLNVAFQLPLYFLCFLRKISMI